MAQYPIKLLKDESGVPFVPLTSMKAVIGQEYVQSAFTAIENSTGHFTITNDKLTDEDLLNRIIAVSFPEDITPTTNSYLKLNNGTEYLITDENSTGPLLIKDFVNVVCFIIKKERSWQLVKTGAEATASSGGHTIVDNDGNVLPQQSVLQFKGFGVSDNAGTGATVISTPALVNNLSTSESGTGPLDAYQGKVLNDKFDNYALASSLNNYLPLSGGNLTGALSIKGGLTITDSPGIDLYPQARGALTEGMRIFNASNGYSLLYCGSTSLSDGIVMVSGPDGLRYFDAYVGGSVHRSHLPHKDGTLAHTADTVYGAVRDGDGNTISSTYLKNGGSGSLGNLSVSTLSVSTAYINPIWTNNHDTRNSNPTPQATLGAPGLRVDFKANGTDGLYNGGGYHGVISYRSYGSATDWSGGPMHQIGMGANGLSWRVGDTSWSSWKNIPSSYVQSSAPSGNLKVGDVWFVT